MWTAARVATLIGRKFHISYSVSGATRLMHRLGFSPQVPARRVAERVEQAVKVWKEATWAEVKEPGRPAGATSRTWGRRGHTPVVTVSGRRSGRLSVAGLIAMRPGSRPRLCNRLNTHVSHAVRELIDQRDWLTVFLPPAYSPDLNPVEGVRAHIKHSLANLSVRPSIIWRSSSANGSSASSTVPRSSTAS